MSTFQLNSKDFASQTSSAEPVLASTVTGGESIGAVKVLYSNTLSSAVATVDINGYFDDTIYSHYKLALCGLQCDGDGRPKFRAMTAGSADTSAVYWTSCMNILSNAGTPSIEHLASDDGATSSHLNGSYHVPRDSTTASYDGEITFSTPQASDKATQFYWRGSQGSSGTTATFYMVFVGATIFKENTALTGISIINGGSDDYSSGSFTLYGYKK